MSEPTEPTETDLEAEEAPPTTDEIRPSKDGRTVYQRMADAIADLTYIPKAKGEGVSYAFRSIDAAMNALHPVLARHGLFNSGAQVLDDWALNPIPGTNNRTQHQAVFRITVTMYGANGDSVTLGPGLAQSHDYSDKAVYQAQQNAWKYLVLEAFSIPTEEPDMDGRDADSVPDVDTSEVAKLIEQAKSAGVEGNWDRAMNEALKGPDWVEYVARNLRNRIERHVKREIAQNEPEPVSGTEASAERPEAQSDRKAPQETGVPDDAGEQAAREVAAAEVGAPDPDPDRDPPTVLTGDQLKDLIAAARDEGRNKTWVLKRARTVAESYDLPAPKTTDEITVEVAAELYADLQQK